MIENTTSPEELEELREQFKLIDVNGDGVLSKQEIKDCAKEAQINLTPKQIDEIFLYNDKNNSGCIEFDEFILILTEKSQYQKEEKIRGTLI